MGNRGSKKANTIKEASESTAKLSLKLLEGNDITEVSENAAKIIETSEIDEYWKSVNRCMNDPTNILFGYDQNNEFDLKNKQCIPNKKAEYLMNKWKECMLDSKNLSLFDFKTSECKNLESFNKVKYNDCNKQEGIYNFVTEQCREQTEPEPEPEPEKITVDNNIETFSNPNNNKTFLFILLLLIFVSLNHKHIFKYIKM